MACVGHGGDCGGDPPPPGKWRPASQCGASRVRGPYNGLTVRQMFDRAGKRKLPVIFDTNESWEPVGQNSAQFARYLTMVVGDHVPMYYPTWDHVPQHEKDIVWPKIMKYWDLQPWLDMPGSNLRPWLTQSFQKAYRDKKADFKKNFWTNRGGNELGVGMRELVPENMQMSEWQKYCDFVMDPREIAKSQRNKVNRTKQTLLSTHGGNSYAQRRWEHRDPETGQGPSYVDEFGLNHIRKSGEYICDEAAQLHEEMLRQKNSQPASSSSVNDQPIVEGVLGTRSGHSRGVGRKKNSISQPSSSQPSQNSYVQTLEQTVREQRQRSERVEGLVLWMASQFQQQGRPVPGLSELFPDQGTSNQDNNDDCDTDDSNEE